MEIFYEIGLLVVDIGRLAVEITLLILLVIHLGEIIYNALIKALKR